MDEMDVEDINYQVRAQVQGAQHGDMFADIGNHLRSWRPELGGGDMMAHGRLVQIRRLHFELGRTRRVMKKVLNMATFVFVVIFVIAAAAFLINGSTKK